VLLSLNNRRKELNCSVVRVGTDTQVEASIREMAKTALRCGATVVVVAHNHPLGACTPSKEDIETTKKMVAAFEKLDIVFLDHLIFGEDGEFYSLRESPFLAPAFSGVVSRLDEKRQGT
jgi:DNA repair protein RadC